MKQETTSHPAPTPSGRLRDAAVVLPLLGLFAWMPPVIALFAAPHHVLGIPLIVAWLFGVWLVLIAAALYFSRRLDADEAPAPAPAHAEPVPENDGQAAPPAATMAAAAGAATRGR